MKNLTTNHIYFLEFLLTLGILLITSNGVFIATLLGVLFIVLKKVLQRYNLIDSNFKFSGLKTMGTVWGASLVKSLLTIIF